MLSDRALLCGLANFGEHTNLFYNSLGKEMTFKIPSFFLASKPQVHSDLYRLTFVCPTIRFSRSTRPPRSGDQIVPHEHTLLINRICSLQTGKAFLPAELIEALDQI